MRGRATLTLMVLVAMLCGASACLFVGRAGLLARRVGVGQGAAGTRALLCAGSIRQACDSGLFTVHQLEYMRASRESCDARDVVWHRAVTRLTRTAGAEGHEPDHARNNAIMHALEDAEYAGGTGAAPKATGRGRGRGRRPRPR